MTNLERTLASILDSIEMAKNADHSLVLAAQLQRKDTICAALAAPEHSWHGPLAGAPDNVSQVKVLMPSLANSYV